MKAEIRRLPLRARACNATSDSTLRQVALSGVVAAAFIALASPALAQQQAADEDDDRQSIDEVTVVADRVGLLRDRESDSMFGINRSLVDTPRSISVVSEVTMDRYSIETIDDFITTTPGTYGGSFFGVPGAISVRGRRGENYFRGFKRITNNGFFPLPVGASSRVEIIRGPTPVLYGAGRVGGLLNFYPKTVAGENISAADGTQGFAEYTVGSYGKNNVAAQLTAPFQMGGREAGLSLYGEFEDSESFYRGREPEQQILQASFNSDLGNGFSMELGGMYYSSDGYNQTPGWNRLTQDLVDNGTYITGRDTFVSDLGGTGFLSRSDFDTAVGTFFGASQITQYLEFFFGLPAGGEPFDLDEGVGTTQLSRRNVVLSPLDIWESDGVLMYGDLTKELDDGSNLKFQLFFDQQDADGSLTTGFAAVHEMDVFEARMSYNKQFELSDSVGMDFYTMLSHREYNSVLKENFLQGYVVLDRLDLSVGATPGDIVSNPFIDPATPWESDFDTTWDSTALAVVTDFNFGDNFALLLNGRYDDYSASGIDNGTFSFGSLGVHESTSEDDFSWSASLSYTAPQGFVPYLTYAEGSEVRANSNGGISPDTIASDSILADSELSEGGIKFSLLDAQLYGTLAYYRQSLSRTDPFGNRDEERSSGFEAELSYVVNDNWALTAAATMIDVRIEDPDPTNCADASGRGEFLNIPPSVLGVAAVDGYGGIFGALNASCLTDLQGGYERTTIPEDVFSVFGTYTTDPTQYGTFGATFGGTRVSQTSTLITNGGVTFPEHEIFRLALFAEYERLSVIGTVDNLFDERYFKPVQGVFQNVAVIPGEGRTWRLRFRYNFGAN